MKVAPFILSVCLRLIRSAQQVVDRDIIIVRKAHQHLGTHFPGPALVAADAVLTDIQVESYLQLCVVPLFPQLAQSILMAPACSPVDINIPKWYILIIPIWYKKEMQYDA